MAPPAKRRCLFFCSSTDTAIPADNDHHNFTVHGFAHTVDELDSRLGGFEKEPDTILQHADNKNDIKRQAESVVVVVNAAVVQTDITVALDALTAATVSSTSSSIAAVSSAVIESSALPLATSVQPASTSAISTSTAAAPVTSSIIPLASAVPSLVSSTASGPASGSTSALTTSLIPLSSIYVSASSTRNTTLPTDSLTSSLNLNSSTARLSSTHLPHSNSSFGLHATYSLTATSSDIINTSDDGSTTSTITIFTTTGADGQPSTITSVVGAPARGTPPAASPSDPTISTGTSPTTAPVLPPPGTIAGGVVGGAAGLAVLLLVAMLFLRWFRQRSQRIQQPLLPADSYSDSPKPQKRGPGMAEGAGMRPLLSAVPMIFRHQQHASQDRTLASPSNERGFQRLSGRKLPSAFSPGMEYEQRPPADASQRPSVPPMPLGSLSGRSATVSGNVSLEDSLLSRQTSDEQMTMLPGPQRRPTIHNNQAQLQVPGTNSHSRHVSLAARTSGILS